MRAPLMRLTAPVEASQSLTRSLGRSLTIVLEIENGVRHVVGVSAPGASRGRQRLPKIIKRAPALKAPALKGSTARRSYNTL